MNDLQILTDGSVSVWLDYLSKSFIEDKKLADYIINRNVVGVTTNPSIFQASIKNDDSYSKLAEELLQTNPELSLDELLFDLIINDVKKACDEFTPIYNKTSGYDGRVSIEVSPDLANDYENSVEQARSLWKQIAKPNLMIKIPATTAGIKAIETLIGEGISINATLIFSVEQYTEVAKAYINGLKKAKATNLELEKIHSVASIFVSRIDSAIDPLLQKLSDPNKFLSTAGIYNALAVYDNFEQLFSSSAFADLENAGANTQRPLWASTGVKNPDLPANYYAMNLILPNTVNTLPKGTIDFMYENETDFPDKYLVNKQQQEEFFSYLTANNIDLTEILENLKVDGINKFIQSRDDLKTSLKDRYFND